MENLKNLLPFYVGEPVVRIAKGTIHKITGVRQYKCGCWSVSVDIKVQGGIDKFMCSYHTLAESGALPHNGYEWFRSSAFAPLQQTKFPLIEYHKVLEKERQLITSN